jgi:hypothetical protein
MDLLRKAQRNVGSGLKGAGKRDLLAEALEEERLAKLKNVPVTIVTYPEPADLRVWVDTDTQRPAFQRGGEVIPYTVEEMAQKKDTEFALGTKVHTFRGTLRPGTSIRDGPGSLHYASGDCFIGRFRNHMKSGAGTLLSPTGYSVEGTFMDDHPHGVCLERYPGGDAYLGEFAAGVPHGFGVLYYERNGSRYEGNFEKGEKHGKGAVFYANGDIFQGTWRAGAREGYGVTTSAETGRSYSSEWRNDEAKFETKFAADVTAPRSSAKPLVAVASPLGVDLRQMSPLPDLITDLHPSVFLRIKAAFEAFDADCVGEIDLGQLRLSWMTFSQEHNDDGEGAAANDSFARSPMGSFAVHSAQLKNGELLAALQRASTNGVTLALGEVIGVLVPKLPDPDLRRALTTDLTPETVHRIRGVLATVASKHPDTFAALGETAASHKDAGRAPSASNASTNKGPTVLNIERVQANKLVVGGLKVSQAIFLRAAAVDGTPHGLITFPQLLRQLYPHLSPGAAERAEVDSLPLTVLRRYAKDFDRLDALQQHHVGVERLKAAQRRWQHAVATEANFQLSPSMRAPGSPSLAASDALDHHAVPGFWRHVPVWTIGDIELTVHLAKLADRHRTGWVSLLDLLRFSYPNIPCLTTRERLGQIVRAEDQCGCVLCAFCGERYTRPRPPSPYVDPNVAW